MRVRNPHLSRSRHMIHKLIALLILAGALTMTGCNTMSGMGEDIEAAGDKIDDSAEKNKKY
jgi:predicted small secreted protein